MYNITSSSIFIKSKSIYKQLRHKLSHEWYKRATMMLAMFALIISLASDCMSENTNCRPVYLILQGNGGSNNGSEMNNLGICGYTERYSSSIFDNDRHNHTPFNISPTTIVLNENNELSYWSHPFIVNPIVIPTESFTRAGYEFVGWSETPDGAIQYQSGDNYLCETVIAEGGKTAYGKYLYAIWSEQDNALHFDGENDSAITSTLNVDQSIVPSTTWEAWICPTTNDQNSRMIMGVEDGDCDRYVAMNGGNFVIGTGTGSCTWTPVAIDLNRWQHIAVVYNEAAGVVQFYKNGVAYSSSLSGHSTAVKFGIGSAQTGFGGGTAGASQFFKGMIDEVRVWRGARTQTQLQEAMYNYIGSNFTDLMAYYQFNQGKASAPNAGVTTLRDSSGNGHHATLSNFALTGDTSNWAKSLAMMVPNAVEASSKTTTSFVANWDAPVVGKVDNYVLDVARNTSFTDMVAQGLNVDSRLYTVSGLTPGTTYYYRVRANRTGAEGQGAFSNIISLKTKTADEMMNGLSFDGVDDYLKQAPGLFGTPSPFTGNSDHTIEFNVLYKGGQTGIRHLFNIGLDGDNRSEIIGFQGETGLIYSSHGTNQTGVTASNAALIPNRWTHLALVYTGSNKSMALYINGTFVETFSYTSDLAIPDSSSFVIGGKLVVSYGLFTQSILNSASQIVMDEFRIWNVARSESQIKSTLNNQLIGTESNLIVYLDFNQGNQNGDNRPTSGGGSVFGKVWGGGYYANMYNFANIGNTSNFVESYAMVVPEANLVTNITATGFTANWTAPAIGTVDNYVLEVSRNATFTDRVAGYDGLSVSGTSVAVTGLAAGTTYYYRVRANKASVTGQGTFSNVVSSESRGKNGLSFNGTTNFVTMPSSASPFTGNADHTIEFNVLYKGGQTGSRSLLWYGNEIDNQLEVIGFDGATGLLQDYHFSEGNNKIATTAALVINHWTHVAMAYTGSSRTMAIYINGTYVETLNYSANLNIPNNSMMQLGTYAEDGSGSFSSRMVLDEVRIWDVARTASQIKGTMNTELVGTEANLKRYYNFNQGTAGATNTETYLTDRTSNAYHGTLTNFDLTGDSSNWVESYAMVVPTAIAPVPMFEGFIANWTAPTSGTVDNYVLEVSTSASFDTFVSGYNGVSTFGNSLAVSGLSAGATYYYRVRADKASVTGQGTFSNVVTVQTIRTDPNVGNALSFDGIDDAVFISSDLTGNQDHTVELYVLYEGGQTGIQNLFTIGNTEKIGFDGATGLIYAAQPVNNSARTATTAALMPNKWTHLAAVYTGASRTIAIYVNGIYVETFSYTSDLAFTFSESTLGLNSKIKLDEFRFWNAARTASQIKANLNNRLSGAEPNLQAYFDFNQGIPSGNNWNRDLTLLNSAPNGYSPPFRPYMATSSRFALTGNTSNFVESYAMVVPTATAATNITATGFTANWTAPAIGIVDNYVLDVSRNATFTDLVAGYNGLSVSGTTANVTGLDGGTTYYYRVRADKAAVTGQGTFSNVISIVPLPTITSFIPSRGNPGTLVTITGTNLGNPTAFTIGGATAIVVSTTGTSLVGMVMPGATTGAISVSTGGGTATGSGTFTVIATPYPSAQQGSKLVGTGAVGNARQGTSISLSADGNTAIVGGFADNSNAGAAWVFIRSGGTWSQQGSKLVGTGAVGTLVYRGSSVALSADGNTAIVGANNDNSGVGAVWVFTRSGSTWSQQGSKLVGTGAVGNARQGCSIALSADGNTAIVGGFADNSSAGAVWVYTRSGSTWTQQGSKLVGTGATGNAGQGNYVSLSSDGNTAIVGGSTDNTNAGAVWVYTRSGSTWTQQGSKLVGTGAVGNAGQGQSVSMSSDGNTAIVGGSIDNALAGAAWVYTRSGSTWTQQGSKLVGTGAVGNARQGFSVALSADGNTAMVGGFADNINAGAAWVYTRSGSTWTQRGSKLVGTGALGTASQGVSISLSADGNTAMVGANNDNTNVGATWVYTVSNTITYNGNSNTGGSVPSAATGVNGASLTLASNSGSLTRTGYTFGGWNTLANGTGTSYAVGASYTVSGDVTLYAQWTANSLTITYDSQSGSLIDNGTTTSGGSIAASPGVPTRTGYTFNGWFAASSGGSVISFPYTHGQTANFTLFAQWTANTLTVTYDSQSGSAISNGSTLTGGSISASPGTPTRTGYTFNGWFAASSGGSAISFPYTHGQTANFSLFAQWTLTSTPPGNALYFDGYDDNAITTTLDTDNSVVPITTWEAWVYPTTNDAEYRMIMGVEDWGCDRFVAINSGNFVVGIGTVACLWAPVTIDLNKWQHIAVVYDEGAGIAKFYKNGVEYISGLSGHTAAVKFGIGCSQHNGYGPAGATQFFQGAIDEVRVWEVARTQSEIQSTMFNELIGNETNLLAYYNFNQGIASETNYGVTTLIDVTDHGHDAPLNNFALSGATSNWVESYAMVVPTASAANSITDTGFTANWTAPVTGTYTHYVLDVATDPTFTYRVSGYDGLAVAGTSENVTGLATGLTYYFRVRADKTSVTGQGAYSNVIAVAVGTPSVMSAPGNALYFDGTTDFVTVPSGASPFTGNADHTVEFNVLYKGGQTGDRWLLWYGTLAGDQIEVIGYNGETGLIKDHHVSAGNDITATTAALVPNKWTHVAMVYTGASRTMAIYINGAYVETFYYASDLAIPDYAPLQLGTFYSIADGVNFTCHMALDEVRIWDVARTESEIRATMYNELAGNETNLKVYYNFNQGTASGTNTPITTLTDRTANGYHGTLYNFDLVGDTSNWVESYAMVVPTASAATSITSAGFTANWTAPAIGTVTNYLLDVATDPAFNYIVYGYDGLSVSGTSQAITGLSPGATYYYRVRADKTSVTGQGAYAAVQTVQLAVDYTITFVPPAGLAGMSNQTIAAGTTANLSANTMTNPGYTFAGWATTSGGAVVYSDGASYTMGTADVTLWSTWIANNPTGVISGIATVCSGTPTQLSITLTGQGPWSGTLSDGTPFSGSDNPLLLSVTPTESVIYTIATLTSATATATTGDLSGSAAVTVNQPTIWYADADLDTFGDLAMSQSACAQPSGYVSNSTDCDDTDGTKWQLATFYVDADADGYANGTASVCSGVGAPTGYSVESSGIDCDDNNNMVYQLNLFYTDVDGDGYTNGYTMASVCSGVGIPLGYSTATLGEDCNDNNNSVYQINLLYIDADGDNVTVGNGTLTCIGATLPAGTQLWQYSNVDDCNDNNPEVFQFNPLYTDEDYDGYTVGPASLVCYGFSLPLGTSSSSSGEDCDDRDSSFYQFATFYIDSDSDGYTNGTASVCSGAGSPTGYSADSSGIDCDDNAYSLSNNCITASTVNLKFYIQGYYSGSRMMTSVKLNQDYESPDTDVEDMTIELHDAVDYSLVDTAVGTLKTDGTISVTFNTAAAGSYYIAVKGSNLVQTWSAMPQTIGNTALNYDFSTSASQAYGDNMIEMESGVFAMYQGDLMVDDLVDLADYSVWESKYLDFAFGVESTDLNGDGLVDLADYSIWEANYLDFIFAVYPF